MIKYKSLIFGICLVYLLVPAISSAQHSHGAGAGGLKMDTREVLLEDIKVTF